PRSAAGGQAPPRRPSFRRRWDPRSRPGGASRAKPWTPVYAPPRLALPGPFQLSPDVAERHAAHDRPPMRTEVGRLRRAELRDEPLHLLPCERRDRLHRGAARHERQGPLERWLASFRPRELVHSGLDEPLWLVALQERGDGAHDDRVAAEALDGEPEPLERCAPALEYGSRSRRQVERLREEQRLRGGLPRVELAPEPLEDHPLVGDVLIEKEHFIVGRRHDERVLNLPEDAAEERTRLQRGGLPEKRGLLGDAACRRGGGRLSPPVVPHLHPGNHRGAPQRLLHGGGNHLSDEARVAEAHPRLRGMDVHVYVGLGERDREHHDREPVAREQRPVRVEHRLGEGGVAHGPPVDEQRQLLASAAREVGRAREATDRDAVLGVVHTQEPVGDLPALDGPGSAGTVSRWVTLPPSPARRVPWDRPRARLVTVKRETAQIAASASPRKPSVAIASRSSSLPTLEVACRSSASGRSSGAMPTPSSVTRIRTAPPSLRSTAMLPAAASRAFSTSSLIAEAGRSTTSPAAILLTR